MSYVLDYEALAAWATTGAVVVALWQSRAARIDLRRQLRHQHALEERNAEQVLLSGMLDALRQRYEVIREYGAALEGEMQTADVVTDPVRSAVDALLRATSKSTAALAAHIHVMSAVRDYQQNCGRVAAVATYDEIIEQAIQAHQATQNFEQWAAQQTMPERFKRMPFRDSPFADAEKTYNASMMAVAKRLAALLAPPD